MRFTSMFLAPLVLLANAAPLHETPEQRRDVNDTQVAWDAGFTKEYPIHRSCNPVQTKLLRQGLNEAQQVAAHARDHILRYGNSSAFYTKYFGKANTAEPAGWFDRIVNADKTGVLFRCDDIDGNCGQPGWAGHWRGSNASDETVICPLSFTARFPLAGVCGYGYTVAANKTAAYFAGDLLHRLYHTDKMGEGVTGHYADSYTGCLNLAKSHPEQAVRNSATLRYFALDVWAFDIALPGVGCTGTPLPGDDKEDGGHGAAPTSSAGPASTPAPTAAPTSTSSSAPSKTSSAAGECHTHADGVVHCV